ncbi:MAG: squalene/phytoene synthase family protein [Syntrophales bacterium]|nr:squalene/phytoene synthase family protein [Syntrophales bacterium]
MELKNGDFKICEDHLGRVSRTFAINMRVLRGDAYRSLLLAYLLCRIADTIEDEPTMADDEKIACLSAYGDLFPPGADWPERVDRFLGSMAFSGKGPDADLLFDTSRVFSEFVKLPPFALEVISERVREMALGMSSFQRKAPGGNGVVMLENQEELESYCYYVAGTVGLMITDLFFSGGDHGGGLSDEARQSLVSRSVSFGLGLQMTNIAKDYMGDRGRGWCYIPRSFFLEEGIDPAVDDVSGNRPAYGMVLKRLIDNALAHLDEALLYILDIPRRYVRYRLFCLWPLLMAVETLALASRNEDRLFRGEAVKIARSDVKRIIRNSSCSILSNRLIRFLYDNARLRVDRKPGDRSAPEETGMFD